MSRLKEPINFKDLCKTGQTLTLAFDEATDREQEDIKKEMELIQNLECIGITDEDNYEEGEPFKIIEKKMFNLTPGGEVKKRIIREGTGDIPQKLAKVKIDYNAFLEYEASPFDSTYAMRRPRRFTLDKGEVIYGLDLGVQSMKLNEKAQFMIQPEYAYRNTIVQGRIPPNATVLFEVELLEIINSGAALTFEDLPEEKQREFEEVYKYALAQCELGKSNFKSKKYKYAIREYNFAIGRMESAIVNDGEESTKQMELLLRIYSNLLVCHNLSQQPRKGCEDAEKIYLMTNNGNLMTIPSKVYFNHAKCLRDLGEYDEAKEVLDKAHQMRPNDPEIVQEYLSLEKEKKDYQKKTLVFAKALLK